MQDTRAHATPRCASSGGSPMAQRHPLRSRRCTSTRSRAPEQRVLGCLIEKRFTTPDQYPLTLNALRLACNQSTNRDPVVDYDEDDRARGGAAAGEVRARAAGQRPHAAAPPNTATWPRRRSALGSEQLAVLCGAAAARRADPGRAQGPHRADGRAGTRSPRSSWCSSELIERGYAQRLERRPGQKEERFTHLLLGGRAVAAARRRAAGGATARRRRQRSSASTSRSRWPRAPRRARARRSSSSPSTVAELLVRSAAPGRPGTSRRRRSRRRASSRGRPPTRCAASRATWRRRPGSGRSARPRRRSRSRSCRGMKMNGITGIIAPRPVEMPAAIAA